MKKWAIWTVAGIGLAGVLWLVFSTDSFHKCVCEAGNGNYEQSLKEYETFLVCFGSFLDAHEAAITAIATGFIAWFTIALSISTKKLWQEATQTSAIAYRSASISERALLQTQRAFISAANLGALPICNETSVVGFVVKVGWTNTGSTSAIHAKAGITYTVVDGMEVDSVRFPDSPIRQNDNMTIGAGTSSINSQHQVTMDEMRKVWKKEGRLFALGRMEYEDVFGVSHHTQICAEIQTYRNPFTFPALANTFNSGIWKEHNSSD